MSPSEAEKAVIALEGMDVAALRKRWSEVYIQPPPSMRSPYLLRLLLAWRIQTQAFGGLDAATRRTVLSKAKPHVGPKLSAGTRITREWRGRTHDVEVIEGGFLYSDRRFASLSEVAREITGVRWNGPRFFGLRKAKAA
ncbi:hypothetical protein KKHFBJBL_00835 [Brevundimonas sp. NIBR11]|nr:hypothetical protein KKHFBJBL_00835 [Brevundimonas sp. NIBR11]